MMQRCAICGMLFDETLKGIKEEIKGKTYWFCSGHCKQQFLREKNGNV